MFALTSRARNAQEMWFLKAYGLYRKFLLNYYFKYYIGEKLYEEVYFSTIISKQFSICAD